MRIKFCMPWKKVEQFLLTKAAFLSTLTTTKEGCYYSNGLIAGWNLLRVYHVKCCCQDCIKMPQLSHNRRELDTYTLVSLHSYCVFINVKSLVCHNNVTRKQLLQETSTRFFLCSSLTLPLQVGEMNQLHYKWISLVVWYQLKINSPEISFSATVCTISV